jgi:hypothetical protein
MLQKRQLTYAGDVKMLGNVLASPKSQLVWQVKGLLRVDSQSKSLLLIAKSKPYIPRRHVLAADKSQPQ